MDSRRKFFEQIVTAGVLLGLKKAALLAAEDIYLERPLSGRPHIGKVLAAIQPHSDDVPLLSAGTVAKLIEEGYTGHLIRATNDDMGDAPGLGTPGTVGDHVLGNQKDNAEVARALGLDRVFDLNYSNHRLSGIQQTELQCRLIFLFRLLKVDTVFCYDPWAHDEENPDHYVLGHCVEAACWMAGRPHDYPEQLAAGLQVHTVKEKYYYARRPEITRVVDISAIVDRKVEANRMNRAKGPAGEKGSQLKAELAKRGERLPLLDGDNLAADRAYIKEFILHRDRELGKKYGVEYAEAFHYIGTQPSRLNDYLRENVVPLR